MRLVGGFGRELQSWMEAGSTCPAHSPPVSMGADDIGCGLCVGETLREDLFQPLGRITRPYHFRRTLILLT